MNDNYIDAIAVYAGSDNHYGAGHDADGKITNLDWHSDNPKAKPTTAQLDAIISSIKTEYIRLGYSRARAGIYPPIGDQLDALWKGGDDATAMKVIIDKVKSDNPK